MIEIKNWMNLHPTEIIVVYFGNMLGNKTKGHKKLRTILETEFGGLDGSVGLNDYWQKNEEWPTLSQAKESNQRIFAIVRTKTQEQARNYFGSKIMPEKQYKYGKDPLDLGDGKFITVLSTYQSTSIGDRCKNIVTNTEKVCQVHHE